MNGKMKRWMDRCVDWWMNVYFDRLRVDRYIDE